MANLLMDPAFAKTPVGRVDNSDSVLPSASTPSTLDDNIGFMTTINDLEYDNRFEDLSDLLFVLQDYYWLNHDLD